MRNGNPIIIRLLSLSFASSLPVANLQAADKIESSSKTQALSKESAEKLWPRGLKTEFQFWGAIAGVARAGIAAAARVAPRLGAMAAKQAAAAAARTSKILFQTSKLAKSAIQNTTKLSKVAQQAVTKSGKLGQLGKEVVKQGLDVAKDQLTSLGQQQSSGILSGPAPEAPVSETAPTSEASPATNESAASKSEATGVTEQATAKPETQTGATTENKSPEIEKKPASNASSFLSGPAPQSSSPSGEKKAEIGSGIRFSAAEAASPAKEEIKGIAQESVTLDKEYKESMKKLDLETKLFYSSIIKTDKAMQADPNFAGFLEVTTEEEANQILAEAEKEVPAGAATEKEGQSKKSTTGEQRTTTQKQTLQTNIKKPSSLAERERDAAKVEASAAKAQAGVDKLAQAFETRAAQLEKAGLQGEQLPSQDLMDDQEVKDIIAALDAYTDDLEALDKAEDEFDDDLYDSLGDEEIDTLLDAALAEENQPEDSVSDE